MLSMLVLLVHGGAMASFPDSKGEPVVQQGLGISPDFGKWPNGTVPWVYNSTNAPAGFTDDAIAVSFIQASLVEWMGVCGVTFQYNGVDDSADINDLTDGIVVFEWDAGIGGAAGQAGPSWNAFQDRTGPGHFEYTDGSLRLNPNIFDTTGLNSSQLINNFDSFFQTVAHEVGHLLGLGHSDDPVSILWANPYNSLNHLRGDDIDACRSMYGYSDSFISSDVFTYIPEAAGVNNFDFLFLASSSDIATQITFDDGTEAGNAQLFVRWQIVAAGYDELLTQVVVDPTGFRSIQTSQQATAPAGGAFGIASFARLRELPGSWTVYVSDSTGLVGAFSLDVQTALPAGIEPPGATLSYTENPATRVTSVTVNVASVSAQAVTPNQVTVNWHVGSQGFSTETVAVPGSATFNVTFADSLEHEMHVEVIDDQPRYAEDGANNIGPAGAGFQTLLPYFSSPLNLGPDGGGDNSSDITLLNSATGELFFWNMHGNLIDPRGAIAVLSDLNWEIAGQGDYNGDGKADILWRHAGDGRIYMWLMDGRVIQSATLVADLSDLNWNVVGNGDFNGDGNADIMWRHTISGLIYFWQMNGATITSATAVATVAGTNSDWTVVGDSDFGGDGRADLMWLNVSTGQVFLWEMNGGSISSANQVAIVNDLLWGVVADGDLNGDGRADLVWQRRGVGGDGKVYFWAMDGPTITSSSRISIVGDQDWVVRGSGDYNGDGMSDLLWYNTTSREVYHWQQNGALTVRSAQISTDLGANWDVVDVD